MAITETEKNRREYRGSIALEAAMAVPIFLFFIMTLLMGIETVRLQTNVLEALNEGVGKAYSQRTEVNGNDASEYLRELENPFLCVAGGEGGIRITDEGPVSGEGIISLSASYGIRPFTELMPVGNIRIRDRVFAHAFTGYTGGGSGDIPPPEEYVYITETGTKYHRSAVCTHIRVTPRAVDASMLETMRNRYGARYYPCERCRPAATGIVFLTGEGTRYHSQSDCPSLSRRVSVITLREAIGLGYTACSKCG
ncbi:MAG: hypothetical protein K6F53_11525 [Lachnospiraceae bacterium]|nr:hypothetical protein [Lachnospiraceae bacterium]